MNLRLRINKLYIPTFPNSFIHILNWFVLPSIYFDTNFLDIKVGVVSSNVLKQSYITWIKENKKNKYTYVPKLQRN